MSQSPLWLKSGNFFKASLRFKQMLTEGWTVDIAVTDMGTFKRYRGIIRHPSKLEPEKMVSYQTINYKAITTTKDHIMRYLREKGGLKNTEL